MEKLQKLSIALLASAALGFGQVQMTSDRRMASPGTVNYLEGQVSLDGQPLGGSRAVVMQPGQTLATGNGFAEVLLTPGAFLRIGNNSVLRFNAVGLANTNAQVEQGSALVEVDQLIKGTDLSVALQSGTAVLEKNGLYAFNAADQSVRVLDGKADVTTAAGNKKIGKDDQILLANGPLKSTGFNSKAERAQPLYIWSLARSQSEAQANANIAQNVAAYGGWYGPGWYWSPYWSSYAYLPPAGYLYSPFGYGWGFYSPGFVGYYGGFRSFNGGFHGRVGGMNAHVGGFRR